LSISFEYTHVCLKRLSVGSWRSWRWIPGVQWKCVGAVRGSCKIREHSNIGRLFAFLLNICKYTK